jgi:hypothetical protein
MSDFTAIVYRQNENLDKMLKPLKESVNFFHCFDNETTSSEIDTALNLMDEIIWQCLGKSRRENAMLITDLTCADAFSDIRTFNLIVIRQSETIHEEFVKGVVDRLKDVGEEVVVIIEKSLADHCELEGKNPYKLTREERSAGGWYYERCKTIWKEALEVAGIKYRFISDTKDVSEYNCPIIADTHTLAHQFNRHRCICAYAEVMEKEYRSIEEILSHYRAV